MNQLHQDNRRRNMELNFLKQACFQGVVFVMELITYFILPRFFTDRWVIFLLTTVSWAAVHSADGYAQNNRRRINTIFRIITLAYNKDLQKQIYRSFHIYSKFSWYLWLTDSIFSRKTVCCWNYNAIRTSEELKRLFFDGYVPLLFIIKNAAIGLVFHNSLISNLHLTRCIYEYIKSLLNI